MSVVPADIIARLRELRALFADAHREGMECLDRGDMAGLGEAIARERQIIEEQQKLLEAHHIV